MFFQKFKKQEQLLAKIKKIFWGLAAIHLLVWVYTLRNHYEEKHYFESNIQEIKQQQKQHQQNILTKKPYQKFLNDISKTQKKNFVIENFEETEKKVDSSFQRENLKVLTQEMETKEFEDFFLTQKIFTVQMYYKDLKELLLDLEKKNLILQSIAIERPEENSLLSLKLEILFLSSKG